MRKYNSIFFLTADPTKNAGSIKDYFINNSEDFVAFHFFPSYTNNSSYIEYYRNGEKLFCKIFNMNFGKNRIIKNLLDFCAFSYTLLFVVKRGTFIIVNAPLYCFFSGFFSFVKSFHYILWIGDYYPQKKFPMNIYHSIVDYYNNRLPYVLYLSPPLRKIYESKRSQNKFSKMIPLGIKNEKLGKLTRKGKKIRLGFIGIIREQQGLELIFEFLQGSHNCILDVIGDGYKLPYYKSLAKKMGISEKVTFYGRIEDVSLVFSKWDIALALYEESEMNLSYYCEPTKIKHYLSYGLPVITTKTTYFHKELEKFGAGIVIGESTESLDLAVRKIIQNYNQYGSGVKELVSKYDYQSWYDKRFSFLH